ncbi:hypothetical protein [Spirillospora sp. NPDC047279]|uniref:hypothetical protein n=1 Tax=Spirillospora sp. NPDC047279 TaxID=3155478 RepID=UPI00340C0D66
MSTLKRAGILGAIVAVPLGIAGISQALSEPAEQPRVPARVQVGGDGSESPVPPPLQRSPSATPPPTAPAGTPSPSATRPSVVPPPPPTYDDDADDIGDDGADDGADDG